MLNQPIARRGLAVAECLALTLYAFVASVCLTLPLYLALVAMGTSPDRVDMIVIALAAIGTPFVATSKFFKPLYRNASDRIRSK